VDWMKFTTVAGRRYTIETLNLRNGADTYLELYDTNGTTRLAYNDDGGGGLASRISWTAPRAATYFIRVRDYYSSRANVGYGVRISRSSTSAADVVDAGEALAYAVESVTARAADADSPAKPSALLGIPDAATQPEVWLAGEPLAVTEEASGQYRVSLPATLAAGAYSLDVVVGDLTAVVMVDVPQSAVSVPSILPNLGQTLVADPAADAEAKQTLVVAVANAVESVVAVTLYGEELPFHTNAASGQLLVTLPTTLKPGTHNAQVWGNEGLLGVVQVDGPTLTPRVYLPNLNR